MKKTFVCNVDITMARTITIDAESEEQAIALLNEEITKNPYNFTHSFSHYVTHNIIDATEEE